MAERQSIKKVNAEKLAGGIYSALFTDGKSIEFDVRAHVPGFDELSEMGKKLLMYGVKQKLDDSMADADGDVKVAQEELQSTIDVINAGQWTTRIAGSGETGGLFARALAQSQGITLGQAKEKIALLVEKNKAKNADASERAVVNAIRQQLYVSNTAFKTAYDELKAKRENKVSSKIQVDLE